MRGRCVYSNQLRCVCISALLALGIGCGAWGAPATGPVKLKIEVVGRNSNQAEVTVSLLDARNQQVPAQHELRVTIEATGTQQKQTNSVIIKAGAKSAKANFTLQESGLIQFEAKNNELRPGSIFARFPLKKSEGAHIFPISRHPAAGFVGYRAAGTRVGTEAGRVADTAGQFGNAAGQIGDAIGKIGGLSKVLKSSDGMVAELAGGGQTLLADGLDAARIQCFLSRPAKSRLQLHLLSKGGKLDHNTITIEKDGDSGEALLTSDETGPVEVWLAGNSQGFQVSTNHLNFTFEPAIVQIAVSASPPEISLLEDATLRIEFQKADGRTIATDRDRSVSVSILEGKAKVAPEGGTTIKARACDVTVKLRPTKCGLVTLKVSAENLPHQECQLKVTWPVAVMGYSALGGSLGGLLAVFGEKLPSAMGRLPFRRRLKLLPWWRMIVGLVTGFVLYWSLVFLPIRILSDAIILNPLSALVCSLLGGWLGLKVFSLVLKTIKPGGIEEPNRKNQPGVQAA